MRNVPLKRITALFGLLASFAASADHSVDACSDVDVDLRRKFGDGFDPEWYANWAGYLAVKRYREQQSEIAER